MSKKGKSGYDYYKEVRKPTPRPSQAFKSTRREKLDKIRGDEMDDELRNMWDISEEEDDEES